MSATEANRRRYAALVDRDGEQCHYCGSGPLDHSGRYRRLEQDHVEPKSQGGPDRAANRVLSCWPCNHLKGVKSYAEFIVGGDVLPGKGEEPKRPGGVADNELAVLLLSVRLYRQDRSADAEARLLAVAESLGG